MTPMTTLCVLLLATTLYASDGRTVTRRPDQVGYRSPIGKRERAGR